MISIPNINIQDRLTNPTIQVGLRFLQLLKDEGITSGRDTAVKAAILGGAVRDAVFKNITPNDIDIFFYVENSMPAQGRHSVISTLIGDINAFLEDRELDVVDLVREPSGDYSGFNNRFEHIFEVMFEGVKIQLMIPSSTTMSVGGPALMNKLPASSMLMLTTDCLAMRNSGFAAQFLPENMYPILLEKDLAYHQKKHPDGHYSFFLSEVDLIAGVFSQYRPAFGFVAEEGHDARQRRIDQGASSVFTAWVDRAVADKFNFTNPDLYDVNTQVSIPNP